MADTTVETVGKSSITLTFTGAGAAWDSQTHFPGGLKVTGIKFFPSAANDILAIRDGSATGPIMAKMKDTTGGGSADISFDGGLWCCPYLLISDCTFNTIANATVIIMIA